MIPSLSIEAWREFAPWVDPSQVEQDLVISRALVEIYSHSHLQRAFAFRGGTALQKLFFDPPTRYSEDIDLVQVNKEPIGKSIDEIRTLLDPWLGKPLWELKKDRATLVYRFKSEFLPEKSMRLKVEINTGEHFSVLDLIKMKMQVDNPWFKGETYILVYEIEELLGTKMRALYQRKKGRDLFDMDMGLEHFKKLDIDNVITCFQSYMKHKNLAVTRSQFEANLAEKLESKNFLQDIIPLLAPGSSEFNALKAGERFKNKFLSQLPGKPWKGIP